MGRTSILVLMMAIITLDRGPCRDEPPGLGPVTGSVPVARRRAAPAGRRHSERPITASGDELGTAMASPAGAAACAGLGDHH